MNLLRDACDGLLAIQHTEALQIIPAKADVARFRAHASCGTSRTVLQQRHFPYLFRTPDDKLKAIFTHLWSHHAHCEHLFTRPRWRPTYTVTGRVHPIDALILGRRGLVSCGLRRHPRTVSAI
jgi:hypothetical protein